MHDIEIVGDKVERYQTILSQAHALLDEQTHWISALANISALLKQGLNCLWVGFYLVDKEKEKLYLGPFQGPVACTEIAKGRGVCGQAWQQEQTLVVPDVNQHPDHIACSSLSKSEIVVPFYHAEGECLGVLDIDSEQLAAFNAVDADYLQQLCILLKQKIVWEND